MVYIFSNNDRKPVNNPSLHFTPLHYASLPLI